MKIYIDGNYYPKEEACVSVFDHGLLYGDGVFEGLRIYNGKIFKAAEHVDRLFASAKAINLTIGHTHEEFVGLLYDSLRQNGRDVAGKNGYIRVVVTRGIGDLGLDPAKCARSSVIIICGDIQLYPDEYYQKGISIASVSVRRSAVDVLDPRIKTLNYLNNIMAKIEAKQSGALEALILNREGFIAECTADNIFMVKDGILYTPTLSSNALGGITRGTVLDLARGQNMEVRECLLAQYDLYTSDECFLTGSGAEIIPVVKADGRIIGDGTPGKVTEQLRNAYRQFAASL